MCLNDVYLFLSAPKLKKYGENWSLLRRSTEKLQHSASEALTLIESVWYHFLTSSR